MGSAINLIVFYYCSNMGRRIIYFLIVQSCISQVLSIYAQPTMQQYLHLAGAPHPAHNVNGPPQYTASPPNIPPTNQPTPATGLPKFSALALPELVSRLQQLPVIQQAAALPNQLASQARPNTGLTSLSALGLPNLVSGLQRSTEVKPANPSSCIDSNLLNNLAIALQLLIVSNILNSPPPAESSVVHGKETPSFSDPIINYHTQAVMPNSNYVGSTSFVEPINIAQTYRPTRNSMSLMSPYEALSPSSSYSDQIFTQYGSSNPRQDFQSPYSMIADTDYLSMNDLF